MKKIICIFVIAVMLVTIFATSISVTAASVKESLIELLTDGIEDRKTEINVFNLKINFYADDTQSLISSALEEVKFMHPEFFDISSGYGYNGAYSGRNVYVYEIKIEYTNNNATYKQKLKEYKNELYKITKRIGSNLTDLEKILYVHELFTGDYEYDLSGEIHDAYNFFTQKKGVCEAYTLAFTAVMQELDIFCTTAVYDGNGGVGHCWNIVKLGDNYYHLDATQDDPVYNGDTPEIDAIDSGLHEFFLCSDQTIKYAGTHEYWYTIGGEYKCEDSSYYNKIWNEYGHPIVYCGGKWYEMESGEFYQKGFKVYYDATLYELGPKFEKRTPVKTFSYSAWNIFGNSYLKPINFYSVGNVLYGTSHNEIWKFDPAKSKYETVSKEYDNIYSSYYRGLGVIDLGIKNYFTGKSSIVSYQLTLGDTDGDGIINAGDLVNVKKYVLTEFFEFNLELCDFNGDGEVSVLDYIYLKKAM